MNKGVVILMIGLGMCGCATTNMVWDRPGEHYTQADFERDRAQCRYEVEMNLQPTPYNSTGGAVGAGIIDGVRTAELTRLCMEAKGWRMVNASTVAPKPPVKPAFGINFVDMPRGLHAGVLVIAVIPGSVAERTGVQKNDIIYGFGDTEITCIKDLQSAVNSSCSAGQTVPVKVFRAGADLGLSAHF
ncbi:MAG: PDZ domain-containing protein [Syntrophobacteraceae bacterium]